MQIPDLAQATIAERYLVERELGRGGMATVWLARDLRHERPVAIKVLHPELAGAIGVDRFLREVRLTAQLQHPNIVPILDSGVLRVPDGPSLPWFAMSYLDGESLRARLEREHQLPVEEALRIAEVVGSALAAAHRQGIVHRDIKPENVFLSNGQAYVVDFGIAKALVESGDERLTSTGLAIGTPAYMSPEQAAAGRLDARSDQYSLATVLYEMLAGEPPFSGPTAQAIVARRLSEAARPLRPVRPTVSDTLERVILRALERAPADRFPDVTSFVTTIRSPASTADPPIRRIARPLLIALGVAALGAGAWFIAVRTRPSHSSARDSAVVSLYRRGVRSYDRRTPAGTAEAVSAFSAAVARDPGYAEAWSGLAKSYLRAYSRAFPLAGMSHDSMLQAAVMATDRALAEDSMNADSWATRSMVARFVDPTDYTVALRAARRSVALDSMSPAGWHNLAITMADAGDLAAATDVWRRCVRADPTYTQCLAFLGLAHYWHRQYDSAAAWADSAVATDPAYLLGRQASGNIELERGDFLRAAAAFDAARRLATDVEVVNSLAGTALVEARSGRGREARATVRRTDSLAAGYVPAPMHTVLFLAQAHVALGETDQAMALLRRFEPQRDLHFQLHLRCDPPFDPVRGDARFRALVDTATQASGC